MKEKIATITPVENITMIGPYAGMKLFKGKNCFFAGIEAGADIETGEGLIIIGDDLRTFKGPHDQPTLKIGNNILIGTKLFGEDINLKEVIEKFTNKYKEVHG